MGIHDKMIQDQIWVRTHNSADNVSEQRTHGQHYLYYSTPNARERIEMSYRSIGRAFDWDMEKYRLSKKPSDKGNRRRFLKNLARFVKNPFGYTFWKNYHRLHNLPMTLSLIGVSFVTYFFAMRNLTESGRMREDTMYYMGAERISNDFQDSLYNPTRAAVPNTNVWCMTYTYPIDSDFQINPVYKQNYRRYFDQIPYGGSK